MKKMTFEKFKERSYKEIIQEYMKINNGYISTKDLEMFDIHRMYLKILKDEGFIEKVAPGLYIDINKIVDPFYVFSVSMSNAVISHMTALYLHGYSIKAPNAKYDITVKRNYHNSNLKKHNIFYVSDDIYNLGLTEIISPIGNKIKVYDIERCICDIIKSKSRMDSEHIKYSIRKYVKSKDKDLIKLSNYAEKMGIKEEIMNYIEVFYE